jgi:hypothetical protein
MQNARGFLPALFDFSFTAFVTAKLLRLVYGAAIVGFGLAALVVLAGAMNGSASVVLATLILVPFGFLVAVTLTRIWCELVVVAFRLAEDAAETAEQAAQIAVNTRASQPVRERVAS